MPTDTTITQPAPARVAVVGAGMVGLSTAWFLQERGVEVTVLDREGVAAGSSWGNAGWLTPGIATPLPEPAVLKYGLRAVLSPSSPVYVPPSLDPKFLKFVTGFTRHSTMTHWRRSMGALVDINGTALDSFDLLRDGGVDAQTTPAASFLAAYRTEAERRTLLEELDHIHGAGQGIEYDLLTGAEARTVEPRCPRRWARRSGCAASASSTRASSCTPWPPRSSPAAASCSGPARSSTSPTPGQASGWPPSGSTQEYDAVVLATGAWLGRLARPFGVRMVVQAGRGYSF